MTPNCRLLIAVLPSALAKRFQPTSGLPTTPCGADVARLFPLPVVICPIVPVGLPFSSSIFPPKVLEDWLRIWAEHNGLRPVFRAQLRPVAAGSDFLELSLWNDGKERAGNIIFADVQDRHGHKLLSIRDMNTFDPSLRKKRLMTLAHFFLLHRYKAGLVHYLSPTEDNQHQALKMQRLGIFGNVNTEAGLIIVASVEAGRIAELLNPDRVVLRKLITKTGE